jgi:hypothetical protein
MLTHTHPQIACDVTSHTHCINVMERATILVHTTLPKLSDSTHDSQCPRILSSWVEPYIMCVPPIKGGGLPL